MKPPRSVLVVVTRRVGDVLLATPLIRSLKRAWPEAAIDVLVFEGTEGVLAANPDIRRVIAVAERPRWRQHSSKALLSPSMTRIPQATLPISIRNTGAYSD